MHARRADLLSPAFGGNKLRNLEFLVGEAVGSRRRAPESARRHVCWQAVDRLPTGIVTFLFTDVEGSTRLVQALGEAYAPMLADHRRLIETAVTPHGGLVFGSEGDALFIAFERAGPALAAAVDAQRALAGHPWPAGHVVRVRMGLHTGEAALVGGDYVGLTLHQVARIAAAGHGGQVLVSGSTHDIAGTVQGIELRDLGEHRLKDLARPERLYQLVADGLPETFPPIRTRDAGRSNLPVQLTSFVGRAELGEVRRLLERTRLLTLTGPGGTGKTRLALELAADVGDGFADGVVFVALDVIRDPDLAPARIAAALGLADPTGGETPLDQVVAHLRERIVLLVLDNVEQVISIGPTVVRLLREAPRLTVIATSRIPLRVAGEQEYPVPPLALPSAAPAVPAEVAARSEAVRLFVERAMAVDPRFRLDDANAPIVADIVRRLDGLPLAIELAAARMRSLRVEGLRDRLDRRLGILTAGPRDAPDRQRTLRGAIDWSHDLLDEPDRRLFARFSVFEGGAFLPEAESVCGPGSELREDVLGGLDSLVEKSLVRSVDADTDPRFAMLATIHEYALERLEASEEAERIRRRHAEAVAALAERAAPELAGADAKRWLDRLAADHENMRTALDWAIANDEAAIALRIVAGTWRFWQARGHLVEASGRIDSALGLASAAHQPPALRSAALRAAGSVGYWRGDFETANRRYREALDEARRSGDKAALAAALYDFGFVPVPSRREDERFSAGRPSFEESLQLYHELGHERGIADANWALTISAAVRGDFAAARAHAQESRRLRRLVGDLPGVAWCDHILGLADIFEGRLESAVVAFRDALHAFIELRDEGGMALGLIDFALVAFRRGDPERMWRLHGALERTRADSGLGLLSLSIAGPTSALPWNLPKEPSNAAERAAFEVGEAMPLDEAVAYALAGEPTETP